MDTDFGTLIGGSRQFKGKKPLVNASTYKAVFRVEFRIGDNLCASVALK